MNGTTEYRKRNYLASHSREQGSSKLHPALLEGLKSIARRERKTVSWVIESALADYFGIEVMLRKLKTPPKPAYSERSLRIVRRRA